MSDEPELPGQLEIDVPEPEPAPARWHRGPAAAERKPAERKPDEEVRNAGRVVE